jgi:phosphoribosylformylglycinamidine synthase
MPDIYKTVSPEFKNSGDNIYILGETHDELGGGEYYKMLARMQKTGGLAKNSKGNSYAIGNDVPKVNLEKNLKTYLALENVISKKLISSAISITSGGLAIALAKASVGGMLGCNISFKNLLGDFSLTDSALFSESQGRIVITVSKENIKKFEKEMKEIDFAKIGNVKKDGKFIITDKENRKIVDTNIKKLFTLYHDFSNKMK